MKRKREPVDPVVDERCRRVIDLAFRGEYHCSGWDNRQGIGPWGMELSVYGSIATYDFDVLTRLVVAAHDEAVRVDISPSGPRLLKLSLFPREREGSMTKRHPTMEEAVESARKWTSRLPTAPPADGGGGE